MLLDNLRKQRLKEIEDDERAMKSEARSPHHLFEKEYLPGKGMKTGGHGGLIVGRHYQMKQ